MTSHQRQESIRHLLERAWYLWLLAVVLWVIALVLLALAWQVSAVSERGSTFGQLPPGKSSSLPRAGLTPESPEAGVPPPGLGGTELPRPPGDTRS